MIERKTQLSVFLEPQVLLAAKQRAREMKLSMSAVVAEAAKESLLSSYRSEREAEILKAVERNFHALRRLDHRLALEIAVLKEMVGLGMRSFFNHTTPIPEATKAAAILSGKQRFHSYLDMLARNLRKGESILSDLPMPEFDAPTEPKPPEDSAGAQAGATDGVQEPVSRPVAERQSDRAATQPARTNGQKGRDRGLFESADET